MIIAIKPIIDWYLYKYKGLNKYEMEIEILFQKYNKGKNETKKKHTKKYIIAGVFFALLSCLIMFLIDKQKSKKVHNILVTNQINIGHNTTLNIKIDPSKRTVNNTNNNKDINVK